MDVILGLLGNHSSHYYHSTFSGLALMCQVSNIIWRFWFGAWVYDFENFGI
jgi:hypothetical protein